jgi:hypothetical protein
MSLIQEALKRQQEEMQTSVGTPQPVQDPAQPKAIRRPVAPTPPVVPPVQEPAPALRLSSASPSPAPAEAAVEPPPIPQSSMQSPAAPAKAKKSPMIMIAVIIILIICGAGAFFAFRPETMVEPPAEVPAPSAPADPVPAPAVEPPVQDPAPVTPEPAPVAVQPLEAAPVTAIPPAPPQKEKIIWPIISCSGIVGKGAKGSAFLNGQIKTVNDTIEDVRVVSIGEMGVTLEYQGEKQFVKVGSSTQ